MESGEILVKLNKLNKLLNQYRYHPLLPNSKIDKLVMEIITDIEPNLWEPGIDYGNADEIRQFLSKHQDMILRIREYFNNLDEPNLVYLHSGYMAMVDGFTSLKNTFYKAGFPKIAMQNITKYPIIKEIMYNFDRAKKWINNIMDDVDRYTIKNEKLQDDNSIKFFLKEAREIENIISNVENNLAEELSSSYIYFNQIKNIFDTKANYYIVASYIDSVEDEFRERGLISDGLIRCETPAHIVVASISSIFYYLAYWKAKESPNLLLMEEDYE